MNKIILDPAQGRNNLIAASLADGGLITGIDPAMFGLDIILVSSIMTFDDLIFLKEKNVFVQPFPSSCNASPVSIMALANAAM
eukprot:757268-Hanusia_phi.AAC.1